MNDPGAHAATPDHAPAVALFGAPADALLLLASIPADHKNYPQALHLRGILHATQGDTAQAIDLFEQALRWLPEHDELLSNLSRAYAATARFADALRLLDQVVDLGKASAATCSDRAALLEKLGKDAAALDSYRAALDLDPSYFPAWAGKGNLLHKMENYGEALSCQDRAVSMHPENALARSSRASTLDKLGRMREGLAEHERAQALRPDNAAIWCGHGVSLVLLYRLEDGLHCFDRALALDPSHLQAMINRASVLAELQRHGESLEQFAAVLRLAPIGSRVRAQALHFMGMVMLALGNPAGWAGHEYRLQLNSETAVRDAMAARWSGAEAVAGKRILLWSEQGYGDTIQFCRYSTVLAALGATVLLEAPAPLLGLCASLPASAVFAKGGDLPKHDFHIPMMSMPFALQNQPPSGSAPCAGGYLRSDTQRIEKWKHALPPAEKRPRIGIACSGAPRHKRNAQRSIPLEKMLPLARLAQLVILQTELTPHDAAIAAAMPAIIQPSLDSGDFSDVAGLIANVDLVVAVDTSIAHLAGAMGVPVWIVLPWNAEWRWMTRRADTPWYGSATLFRQPAPGDWDSVIADVLRALGT